MPFKGEKIGEEPRPLEEEKTEKEEEKKEKIEVEETELKEQIPIEQIPEAAKQTLSRLEEAGFEGHFVGGCVRDLLLKREPKDWDITTNADPEQIQETFPKSFYENKFGTVTAITGSDNPALKLIEITPYRIEGKYTDKRHPDEIKFAERLEDDLKRRDFTINALAATLKEGEVDVVDLFNGREDLNKKLIRTVGDPRQRFEEDALRLMRAPRFAVQLGFEVEPETAKAIKQNAYLLDIIAKERIRDEVVKIMETPDAVRGIKLLRSLDLLKQVVPELAEKIEKDDLSLPALIRAVKKDFDLAVRFAAFFRDINEVTKKGGEKLKSEEIGSILKDLKFSGDFEKKTVLLFENYNSLRGLEKFTEFDARCLWRKITGRKEVDEQARKNMKDLISLRLAGNTKKIDEKELQKVETLLEKTKRDPISRTQLKVDGSDIMKTLNINPGPKVGDLLYVLLAEVIENPEKNKKEYLISRARELHQLNNKDLDRFRSICEEKIDGKKIDESMQEKSKKIASEETETRKDIFEKEVLSSENFEIHYDKGIKEIIEPNDNEKFDEVKGFVENTLGSKWEIGDQKLKVYLFSDKEQYSDFLKENFPDAPKDNATFDKKTNSIADLTKFTKKEDKEKLLLECPHKKEEIEKYFEEYSEEEIRNMARGNMFSGVGHELAHLHPLFGGVGNKNSENKWEQEMVCTFIGEKIRTKYGNERLREDEFRQAREELKELQKQGKHFSWEERGKDWDNWPKAERFVYPWLEEKYGQEKLQDLWETMFKEKKTIAEATKDVYGKEVTELEKEFTESLLSAEKYSGFLKEALSGKEKKREKNNVEKEEQIKSEEEEIKKEEVTEKSKEVKPEETEKNEAEKEKRDIKIIEKLPLGAQDRMELALTYFGEKPSATIDINYYEERPYVELSEVLSKKELLEKNISNIGLDFKAVETGKIDQNGFEHKGFQFFIGKNADVVEQIQTAWFMKDEEKTGVLLGYPKTAVEAFSKRTKERKLGETMFDKKAWWKSLSEKERKEISEDGFLNFLDFRLSKEHWKEELETVKKWQKKIKEKTPKLYKEIIERKPAKPLTKKEAMKWEKKETEKGLKEIEKRVERIKDAQGKPIEKGIKETDVLLNALGLRTSQSCEGHLEKTYSSAPWVEIYSRLASTKEGVKTEKIQETKERMEQQNLHFRKKATNLLGMFYQNREVPIEQRLCLSDIGIYHAFRIQSQGAEKLDNLTKEEQKNKLRRYRQEMQDFTQFLKEKCPAYSFLRLNLDKEPMSFKEELEKTPESIKLKQEGEKIYKTEFTDKLDKVLDKEFKIEEKNEKGKVTEKEMVLKDILEEDLKKFKAPEFSRLSKEQKAKIQEEFLKNLTEKISKIPSSDRSSATWSCYFSKALKTGEMNCSACASLNALILENTKKITEIDQIEFGLPHEHAMNIITLSNGQIYYVDPRNNVFENLSRNIKIENKNGLKVYKIKELRGGMDYKIIPTLNVKEGIIAGYLDNLPKSAKSKFPSSVEIEGWKKIKSGAKEIFEEKEISNERFKQLKKLKNFFNKKLYKYQESKEFKSEIKRVEEYKKFVSALKPIIELVKNNNEVSKELAYKKREVISFLLFARKKIGLKDKGLENEFKKFREKTRQIRKSNPDQYIELIRQMAKGQKKY